jgi:transglutaminase-like putative cysteine protease
MQKTWFCYNWNQRGLISILRLLTTATFALAALAGSPSFAAAPDWLRQAARVSASKYSDDTDAVVLLDERLTTVSPTGEVRITYRKALKILRPAGRTRGTVFVYFDNEAQLNYLKAWSITAQNEEYEVKESDAAETAAFSESLYADTRFKLLQIPAAQPGSVIGYEYRQRQRSSVLQTVWSFQDEIPVRRARFLLELPPKWGYSSYWRNHGAEAPQQIGDNRWLWELVDLEPIKSEPKMPTWRSVAGQLGIAFGPNETTNAKPSYSNWAQIGRWYAGLTAGRREITPLVRDKDREIATNAADPLEKIRLLSAYVQHAIRYVAIETGIGGYQPHSAQEVLANGYGDCKDKATLLSALLRGVGIDSYYVLVNADRDYLAPDFPTALSFNHVILAIRLPRDVTGSGIFAILRHDTLGPLLLFDPTDSTSPLGYLPPSLQLSYGLLVTDADGELVQLPLLPPPTNRLLRIAKLSLDKFGNLKGNVEEVRTGPAAWEMKLSLLSLPKQERQKVFENLLSELIDGAVLTSAATSDLKDPSGSLNVSYDLTVPAYAQHAGALLLFRSCVLGHKSSDVLEGGPRRQPIVFSYATLEGDICDITFPTDYTIDEMPGTVKYEYPFATYKSQTRVTNNVVHYDRNYELKQVRVATAQLEDLKKFFREIADDERAYTIMKTPPGSAP